MENVQLKRIEMAATVIQDLKKKIHKCMMENIETLTDEEREAVASVINLIYSGGSESVNENVAVVGIFEKVQKKVQRNPSSGPVRFSRSACTLSEIQ